MLARILFLILFLFSTNVFAQSLIIDTDADLDDMMAMLYLFQKKNVDVKAISVVCGGASHCDIGAENIKKVIALTQHKPIPIAIGQRAQYSDLHLLHNWSKHKFPAQIIRESDTLLDNAVNLAASSDPTPIGADAVELIANVLRNSPVHSVDILAIGPLTNLAEFAHKHPDLMIKINHVYMMGGAVHVGGNLMFLNGLQAHGEEIQNAKAEWNMYIDPNAAYAFFHHPSMKKRIYMVPLDVTNKVPVDESFKKMIAPLVPGNTKLTPGLLFYNLMVGGKIPYFWDPLAGVIAVDAKRITAKSHSEYIDISEDSEEVSGATIAVDPNKNKNAVPIIVYSSVDKNKFEKLLWTTINGGSL